MTCPDWAAGEVARVEMTGVLCKQIAKSPVTLLTFITKVARSSPFGESASATTATYSLRECLDLVHWLKAQGCTVMLGVPSFWRAGQRDAVDDPLLLEAIKQADIVSPWSVGRYRTPDEAARHAAAVWQPDRVWCDRQRLTFFPSSFPDLAGTICTAANLMTFAVEGSVFVVTVRRGK